MPNRKTVYNEITSQEKLSRVNPENISLGNDFLEYLASIDRSKGTIKGYASDLDIFWCYNLEYNNNKFFINLTKREIAKFQNHCINTWKWSSGRVRRVKSVLSSLSNYIENILDDEYKFKSIVRKIENPSHVEVREKTVFTAEQLQGLLDYLVSKEKYDKACMLALGMFSGRRKAELPRMKLLYFNQEHMVCDGAFYQTPEKVMTKGRGSKGKPLNIFILAKPFEPYLRLWIDYREKNKIESEWLIPRKENGVYIDEQMPISTMDSWAKSFSNILKVPFYWHSLRHYFTTMLSESNVPDSVIQDIIGWESADMCRLYTDTKAEEKLKKYFGAEGVKQVEEADLTKL